MEIKKRKNSCRLSEIYLKSQLQTHKLWKPYVQPKQSIKWGNSYTFKDHVTKRKYYLNNIPQQQNNLKFNLLNPHGTEVQRNKAYSRQEIQEYVRCRNELSYINSERKKDLMLNFHKKREKIKTQENLFEKEKNCREYFNQGSFNLKNFKLQKLHLQKFKVFIQETRKEQSNLKDLCSILQKVNQKQMKSRSQNKKSLQLGEKYRRKKMSNRFPWQKVDSQKSWKKTLDDICDQGQRQLIGRFKHEWQFCLSGSHIKKCLFNK